MKRTLADKFQMLFDHDPQPYYHYRENMSLNTDLHYKTLWRRVIVMKTDIVFDTLTTTSYEEKQFHQIFRVILKL